MSQRKDSFVLRKGQKDLVEYLPSIQAGDVLSLQWPTGYGKSVGFALAWAHAINRRLANRFLLVVANDTQRAQIINDFSGDCLVVGAPCRGGIWSFDRSASDLRAAMTGTAEVFVCTVQQLEASNRGGLNTLKELLTSNGTRWMVGFDEFHHYGEDMPWGESAKAAMRFASFVIAMSATPYRRGSDLVFPEPHQVVTYAKAVEEGVIKAMLCHSYDYKVTVVDGAGERSYTTSELLEEAAEEAAGLAGLDKWEERRNIRYSPQYIHPLILHPLTRLMQKRAESGIRLQMLIRAMSCSHAEMVCQQVKTYTNGGLVVDWIGTGPKGRSSETNDSIRRLFCPPKKDGVRPSPTIDVLVQVSMAGEGFDSINVAEIVDLFPVSKKAASGRATADKQFYGRGSRIIPSAPNIRLHVSVPTDHPLHVWAGMELHRWMDSCGDPIKPRPEDEERKAPEIYLFDFPDLPRRREIELLNITTEDEHFKQTARKWQAKGRYDLRDPRQLQEALEDYRTVATFSANEQAEQARMIQTQEQLDSIIGRIAYILAKQSAGFGGAVNSKDIGKNKMLISTKLKTNLGKARDAWLPDEMERAYTWCQNYLRNLKG